MLLTLTHKAQFGAEHTTIHVKEMEQEARPRSRWWSLGVLGGAHVGCTGRGGVRLQSPALVLTPFSSFSLKTESFIPGRHITSWEVSPSSPEILPTVL